MISKNHGTGCDYLCEKRLLDTDPVLHGLYRNSVFAMDLLLGGYKNIFPYFTDHSYEHSAQVINYCNLIAGEEIITTLNSDELYILLMSASLHDVGMGISEDDFILFSGMIPELADFRKQHPGKSLAECTRAFHQLLGAQFIRKYSSVFEIPSEQYVYCIAQIVKGHRKADLLDLENYPVDYRLANGNTVNLAYLSALVKLADELDVTADRNLFFDYAHPERHLPEDQIVFFKCHDALKKLRVRDGTVLYQYDTNDPVLEKMIAETREKVEKTFREYMEVVEKRTSYSPVLHGVRFEKTAQPV